jgi:hypothetical protein
MPTSPWKTLPQDIPADGQEVLIRDLFWNKSPYAATWSLASQTFTTTTNSLTIYWFLVQAWRPVP